MPEHTLPDALHPQQEDAADELQLRGGLKGRFFADFCLLQSTVDALQNYLVHAATPDVQDMAAPLLEEMKQRIFRLERLADNAVDLVAQSQPPRQLNSGFRPRLSASSSRLPLPGVQRASLADC